MEIMENPMLKNSIFNPKDKLNEQTIIAKIHTKFYLGHPFELNKEAKLNGAKWDRDELKWYVLDIYNSFYEKYKLQYLINDYNIIDVYKANKAHWNHQTKRWFTFISNEELKEYFIS